VRPSGGQADCAARRRRQPQPVDLRVSGLALLPWCTVAENVDFRWRYGVDAAPARAPSSTTRCAGLD